ncbi:glycosyl hydrolase catalytic core-domain-containing protein [Amylocarpus encephaloides]|uniref:Glycosyl hydrolase catalytic core-domain-containing protein n=1 Tax=Amylocarpus encephaloides TaxID=45428 RepID=A0A9P7YC45_9HELO|nr:glycosyl hydrolase catalytic core-domain-containing protein [Amylocarpus encephaloides]
MFSPHTVIIFLLSLLGLTIALAGLQPTPPELTFSNASEIFSPLPQGKPPYHPRQHKRGLPFNNPTQWIQSYSGPGSEVNWAYNWDSAVPDNMPRNLQFVPMLWGGQPGHTINWARNAQNAINRGASHLLAFNEPDQCGPGQSCIGPVQAAALWKRYMEPFTNQAWLGAPATTNADPDHKWLKQFLAACTGCHVDFVPIHWYNSYADANTFQYLVNWIQGVKRDIGPRNIWVTEFNAGGIPEIHASEDQQISFLRKALPWMDNTDYIERYAWFWTDPSFRGGSITAGNRQPTKLGYQYAYGIHR